MKIESEVYKAAFCAKLKELRREMQLYQKDIAEKLSVPLSTYANWEQGRTEPSVSDIYKLLTVFGIEANELFEIPTANK